MMNMMKNLTTEDINTFVETQLAHWELAAVNFNNLRNAYRKNMNFCDLRGAVQLNPARIISSAANTSAKAIEERPCFLCEANRPAQQITNQWVSGWHLLLNPYPILPIHFTIVNPIHTPQTEIPLEMAAMAEAAPDLVFFYNGARAGASAPDHQHVQAVLKSELPLVRLVEENHPISKSGWISSEEYDIELPFHFLSAVVEPDNRGMKTLALCLKAFGIDSETGVKDNGLLNAFMWIGNEGLLRIVIIPRRKHRPECYFKEGEDRIIISPGAIDMAGLIIIPRPSDFEKVTPEIINDIYSQVAFSEKLPQEIKYYFLS